VSLQPKPLEGWLWRWEQAFPFHRWKSLQDGLHKTCLKLIWNQGGHEITLCQGI
jgi:hypothetical protein